MIDKIKRAIKRAEFRNLKKYLNQYDKADEKFYYEMARLAAAYDDENVLLVLLDGIKNVDWRVKILLEFIENNLGYLVTTELTDFVREVDIPIRDIHIENLFHNLTSGDEEDETFYKEAIAPKIFGDLPHLSLSTVLEEYYKMYDKNGKRPGDESYTRLINHLKKESKEIVRTPELHNAYKDLMEF